jgi:outer membrane receptor protein involved in Fe transport
MTTYLSRVTFVATLLSLFGAFARPALAQDPPPPPPPEPAENSEEALFKLDAILNAQVVTASGGADEERALAPANVFVISRQDIEMHGWRSLAEALAQTPGLYIIDDLVMPSVGVRGVTGGLRGGTRIVRVMIDGQVVNFRPDLTAFTGPEFIPMEAVERIEIAKGPLSALYGANSFVATVNVITRSAAAGTRVEAAGHAWAVRDRAGGGASAFISYSKGLNGFIAAFTADRIDRSGLAIDKTFENQDPAAQRYQRFFTDVSQNDLAIPVSGFGQLHLESPRLGTLEVGAGIQALDSMGEFQVNSVFTHQSRISLQNIWTRARYEKRWNKVSFATTFGYSRGDVTRDYNLYLTDSNASFFRPRFGYWALNGSAEATYSPIPQLDIRAQLDFEYDMEQVLYYTQVFNQALGMRLPGDTVDLIGPNEPTERPLYDVGASLQVSSGSFRRVPGLRLTGNVRIDKISYGAVEFPIQYSWRAVVAYRFKSNLVTKLIGGHAFQTPSGVLMFAQPGYGNDNNIIGNFTARGGGPQTLSPQQIDSVELVASGRIGKRISLEGGAFYQRIADKIEFVREINNFVPTNQGARQQLGFELSAHLALAWFSPYLSANLLLTEANGTLTIDPPPLYPSYFGIIGTDVEIPKARLRINGQVRWVGPRGSSQPNTLLNNLTRYTLPAYADVDVTISTHNLHLFGGDAETRLTVSGRNLVGIPRFEPGFGGFDLPNIGRTFYIELRQLF